MSISFRPRRDEFRERKDPSLVQWAVVLAVFLIVVTFLSLAFKNAGPIDGGVTVDGRVTAVNDPPADSACSVTAGFEVNGQTYNATTAYSSSGLCGFEVGSVVSVSYRPSDPTDNRIVTTWEDSTPWFFLFVVGGAVVLTAVAAVWQVRRRRNQGAMADTHADGGTSVASTTMPRPGFFGSTSKDRATVVGRIDSFERESLPRPAAPPNAPTVIPPGWYLDHDGHSYRWWDGRAWTVHEWDGKMAVQDAGDQDRDVE